MLIKEILKKEREKQPQPTKLKTANYSGVRIAISQDLTLARFLLRKL